MAGLSTYERHRLSVTFAPVGDGGEATEARAHVVLMEGGKFVREEKRECDTGEGAKPTQSVLRWDSNQQPSVYEAKTLPGAPQGLQMQFFDFTIFKADTVFYQIAGGLPWGFQG